MSDIFSSFHMQLIKVSKKKRFTCHCASAIAFQFESTGALNALILCVGISKVETKQKQSYVKIRQETKEKTIFLLNENHEISRNFDWFKYLKQTISRNKNFTFELPVFHLS